MCFSFSLSSKREATAERIRDKVAASKKKGIWMGGVVTYIYRWNRRERKGQPCEVLARGTMNSCLVRFADGYTMVTSRNAIKRNPEKRFDSKAQKD